MDDFLSKPVKLEELVNMQPLNGQDRSGKMQPVKKLI